LVANADGFIKCLAADRGTTRKSWSVHGPTGFLVSVGVLSVPDLDQFIIAGSSDGVVYVFKEKGTAPAFRFQAHEAGFAAIDVHPTLPIIATGGGPNDMSFKLWHREVAPADDEQADAAAQEDEGERSS